MTQRAILSVSDKTGLIALGRELAAMGWELVGSGGTAAALRAAGLPVREVAEVAGAPEMLGGRVKTLHPAIHGGILARATAADAAELAAHHIAPFDLVVANLYPFAATVARPDVTADEAVEQIDIGGVALLRAAAKNFGRVLVLCDPADYGDALAVLRGGESTEAFRRALALKAFALTAAYDQAIVDYLSLAPRERLGEGSFGAGEQGGRGAGEQGSDALPATRHSPPTPPNEPFPPTINLQLVKVQGLRYGENPHQAAALYAAAAGAGPLGGRLLGGKELSYNNLLDLDAAWRAAESLLRPAVVIVKHLSPCGLAIGATAAAAFPAALASDPVSAFGGVIAVNRPVDAAFVAQPALADLFVEAIVAPDFAPEAVAWFAAHKKNCRLLALGQSIGDPPVLLEWRAVRGGLLAQTRDVGDPPDAGWRVVSRRAPTAEEESALRLAWIAAQHVKSNAIVLAQATATVGIGGGLPSRVDAVRLAADKAGARARGAALASDAFFPFADGVEAAAEAGVTAVVEPGGSVRDDEVIAAADRLGLALVFTGARHFRH